jgi:hypothetical protein
MLHIIQAEGLHHMNHFTGDHPYVVCEVKHMDNRAERSRVETKPVTEGDTLNPVWNEMLELEPWQVGEALEITIYDKGLLGSKTEGKTVLPSEFFFPHGFNGMIGIPGLPNSKLHMTVQVVGGVQEGGSAAAPIEAPAMTYAAVPSTVPPPMVEESQVVTAEIPMDVPQKLAVSILEAHGLQQMNHFTGDHPYVVCEVYGKGVKVETKPMTEGDTMNPFWGETHTIEPWCLGDSLDFTVYDKGLLGAKTEGTVQVPPELIYPHGFSGMLHISGLPQALLHVIIRPLGPSGKEETLVTTEASKATKKKKLKIGKKSKGCC